MNIEVIKEFYAENGEFKNSAYVQDVGYLLSIIERCEKGLTKMSTGNFHAPMELSQIEAYQAYAKSLLESIQGEG